ncbi:MAG: hypothetical protein ACOZB3_07780, partial [Calditrichota bacterium]
MLNDNVGGAMKSSGHSHRNNQALLPGGGEAFIWREMRKQMISRKLLQVIIFFTTLICAPIARSDSTWVSGRVSGEWTTAGSPYVIADSTWVSSIDSLTIQSGTEVVFPYSSSQLIIMGRCSFQGTSSDSVVINLLNPDARLACHFGYPANFIQITYTKIIGTGYFTIYGDTIAITNSKFAFDISPFQHYEEYIRGNYVSIHNSELQRLNVHDAHLEISSSIFSSLLFVENCRLDIDNVNFIADTVYDPESIRGGKLYLSYANMRGDAAIRNSRLRELVASATDGFPMRLHIDSTSVTSRCHSFEVEDIQISHCHLGKTEFDQVSGAVNYSTFDTYTDLRESNITFLNNTYIQKGHCQGDESRYFITGDVQSSIRLENNIFATVLAGTQLINRVILDTLPIYNLVWGMLDPWEEQSLGEGNLIADPQIDPNDSALYLQYGSPAINAGNPLRIDPDGTRSDIGAQYWDHRFDHPPIIGTPALIETGWGCPLRLRLTATDDRSVRIIPPSSIPVWMISKGSLDETSMTLYDGRVPYGTRSFTLVVRAVDNLNQWDEESIDVQIYPTYVLSDTVFGSLTREYSPYWSLCDFTIPTSESLMVEAGVHIQMNSENCRPAIRVGGGLFANGNATDSVYIESANDSVWYAITTFGNSASIGLEYCRISDAIACLNSIDAVRCQLNHVTLEPADNEYTVSCAFK